MRRLLASIVVGAALTAAAPVRAEPARVRLLDVTAETLERGEKEYGLAFLRYGMGLGSGLQVSSDLLFDAISLVNGKLKFAFLRRSDLRASLEGAAYWLAASEELKTEALYLPLDLRISAPVRKNYDVAFASSYTYISYSSDGTSLGAHTVSMRASLIRYDATGAFMLEARLPLFSRYGVHAQELLGVRDVSRSLYLDNVSSWGLLLAREQRVYRKLHLRLGAGYRNKPGIILLESVGHVLAQFDVYWR